MHFTDSVDGSLTYNKLLLEEVTTHDRATALCSSASVIY